MKKEKQNEIEASEVMGDIVYSLINGVYTQAREQIKDALENGVNLLAPCNLYYLSKVYTCQGKNMTI